MSKDTKNQIYYFRHKRLHIYHFFSLVVSFWISACSDQNIDKMAFVLSYIFAAVTFIWLFITTLQLASSLSDTTVSASAVKAWALASGQNETSQPPNPTYLSGSRTHRHISHVIVIF